MTRAPRRSRPRTTALRAAAAARWLACAGALACGDAGGEGSDAGGESSTTSAGSETSAAASDSEDATGGAGVCGPQPDSVAEVVLSEVEYTNARGETIRAFLQVPEGAVGRPAVIVLHGSGGLLQEPDAEELAMGLEHGGMERQFREWAELLAAEGYVALFPASFFSRGFFDYNDDVENIPPGFDDEERLRARVLDTHGAAEFLCARPEVCCASLGLIGFSNGGSTTLLSLHETVEALPGLEALPELDARPPFQLGVAYYPGCGLDGLLTLSDDPEDISEFFYPHAPLYVQHAELDGLLEHCPTRALQAELVAESRGLTSPVDIEVFAGVDHGFDSTPDDATEEAARDEARARTLDLLRAALW